MKNNKLYLDDERIPYDSFSYCKNDIYKKIDWDIVKNYELFVDYILKNGLPELISFDHDLAKEHYKYAMANHIPYLEFKIKTGYHCLLWLIFYCKENNFNLPKILIHTMNAEGCLNMKNLIDSYNSIFEK